MTDDDAISSGEVAQFAFGLGEIIAETDSADRLIDTTICEIKQRFVDVDSQKEYYKIEVINVNIYNERYWPAETVESDYEVKEAWSSEEIKEWEDEDWGICPAFSVDHRPERQSVVGEVDDNAQ